MTLPIRDAGMATGLLLVAIVLGSGWLQHLDLALLGYLGAVVVAFAGTVWRVSAFWRRRPSAFYARALGAALRGGLARPAALRAALRAGASDLVGQRFIARRSRLRWIAHLLLSWGTLASIALTVPLVCGWLHFAAVGAGSYCVIVAGVPAGTFAVDGPVGWFAFHALTLAGLAVAAGATILLAGRVRRRELPGVSASAHMAPLALLLVVAVTGLALPATRHLPTAFDIAAVAHELVVILLLVAIPFSKLHHVLVRPLQVGARLVRAADAEVSACPVCGGVLAPTAQRTAVRELLRERGPVFGAQADLCPTCRRHRLARTQAALLDAGFQPASLGGGLRPPPLGRAATPPPARQAA